MSSGPWAFDPIPMPDNARRALLVTARTHRPDQRDECVECGKRYPCPNRLDAVHLLITAGVNPEEWQS